MTTALKRISFLTVVTAISLTALSSGAAAGEDLPTTTVRAWDLDLTDPADVRTLYGRVQDASNRLCRREARRHWLITRTQPPAGWRERCVSDAVDMTVRKVGDPLLAAMHIRTGVAQSD